MKHKTSAVPPSVTDYTGCGWLVLGGGAIGLLTLIVLVWLAGGGLS